MALARNHACQHAALGNGERGRWAERETAARRRRHRRMAHNPPPAAAQLETKNQQQNQASQKLGTASTIVAPPTTARSRPLLRRQGRDHASDTAIRVRQPTPRPARWRRSAETAVTISRVTGSPVAMETTQIAMQRAAGPGEELHGQRLVQGPSDDAGWRLDAGSASGPIITSADRPGSGG